MYLRQPQPWYHTLSCHLPIYLLVYPVGLSPQYETWWYYSPDLFATIWYDGIKLDWTTQNIRLIAWRWHSHVGYTPSSPGDSDNVANPAEIRYEMKSYIIVLAITPIVVNGSFWNFTQSTAVTLPCSVQNFRGSRWLSKNLRKIEAWQRFNLGFILDWFFTLLRAIEVSNNMVVPPKTQISQNRNNVCFRRWNF